ncbi:HdeD family acid-resistance protein [Caenispirillum salinarum]|uniref:HdeD family acid-resistance protein n=1 Tax=Caenispirillum salinarum TaxID=859058 RepID=UPI003850D7B4
MADRDPTRQNTMLASREVLERTKGKVLLVGVAAVILGVLSVGLPRAAAIGTGYALGAAALIAGIVQALRAIPARGTPAMVKRLAAGIGIMIAGGLLLAWPRPAVAVLTLGLGVLAVGLLAMRTVGNWRERQPKWWLPAIPLIALLAGFAAVMWAGWPGSVLWAAGTVGGLVLAGIGWWLVMIGTAHDSHKERGLAGKWPPR